MAAGGALLVVCPLLRAADVAGDALSRDMTPCLRNLATLPMTRDRVQLSSTAISPADLPAFQSLTTVSISASVHGRSVNIAWVILAVSRAEPSRGAQAGCGSMSAKADRTCAAPT